MLWVRSQSERILICCSLFFVNENLSCIFTISSDNEEICIGKYSSVSMCYKVLDKIVVHINSLDSFSTYKCVVYQMPSIESMLED